MKKSIMFATAMIVVAGTLFTKANKETKMSDNSISKCGSTLTERRQ